MLVRARVCVTGQAYFGERWVLLGLLLIFRSFVHDVLNLVAQLRCYLRRSVSATGVCVCECVYVYLALGV